MKKQKLKILITNAETDVDTVMFGTCAMENDLVDSITTLTNPMPPIKVSRGYSLQLNAYKVNHDFIHRGKF